MLLLLLFTSGYFETILFDVLNTNAVRPHASGTAPRMGRFILICISTGTGTGTGNTGTGTGTAFGVTIGIC